ncbi:HNH endonuclease [Vibrio sp. WXL210]|uniref:HNH endonuclease n=1 Tax=Vibrio sp. WXL210 TaxID=3450709 RepID=UPI003EC7FBC0
MRYINRNSIQVPQKLATLYANQAEFNSAKQAIANGTDIKKGLYRHESVELAIETLYKDICFLCQKGVKGNYDVEHLLPWSKHFPERAYDWENLHQSCKECNQKKKRHKYKKFDVTDNKKVIDILLLDPTREQVDQLITFDPFTSESVVTTRGDDVPKAHTTVHFLNSPDYVLARKAHWDAIRDVFTSEEWFEVYSKLRSDYRNYNAINLDFTDALDTKVGSLCYRIAIGFLGINRPYNMFVARVMNENIKVNPHAIKHFAQQHCENVGSLLPTLVV